MRSSFAQKADELVYGDREKTYDDPNKNFRNIAAVWSAITGFPITPKHVALMMTGMKLVREGNCHLDDNVIDAHGYLMCLERIINEELDNDPSAFVPQLGNGNGTDSAEIPEGSRPILTRRRPPNEPRDALDMG